jgi:hypothetical protein
MSVAQASSAGSGVAEGAGEPGPQDRVLGAEVLDLDGGSVEVVGAATRPTLVALRAAVGRGGAVAKSECSGEQVGLFEEPAVGVLGGRGHAGDDGRTPSRGWPRTHSR